MNATLTRRLQGRCWFCDRDAWSVDGLGRAAHVCCVGEHAQGEPFCVPCEISASARRRWERKLWELST